jgi:hypothetical protein
MNNELLPELNPKLYKEYEDVFADEFAAFLAAHPVSSRFTEPEIALVDLERGDYVTEWTWGTGGQFDSNVRVTKVDFKYDEDTGERYKVIHVKGYRYDSRTGKEKGGEKCPGSITPCKQPKKQP